VYKQHCNKNTNLNLQSVKIQILSTVRLALSAMRLIIRSFQRYPWLLNKTDCGKFVSINKGSKTLQLSEPGAVWSCKIKKNFSQQYLVGFNWKSTQDRELQKWPGKNAVSVVCIYLVDTNITNSNKMLNCSTPLPVPFTMM